MSNPFNRREGFKGNVVLRPDRGDTGYLHELYRRLKGWLGIEDGHPAGIVSCFTSSAKALGKRASHLFRSLIGFDQVQSGPAGQTNAFVGAVMGTLIGQNQTPLVPAHATVPSHTVGGHQQSRPLQP